MIAKDLAAGHGDRVLFAGLDLVVAPGDVVGLVGANGAGKSTLLRTLAGLQPRGGRARVALSPPTATRRLPAAGARAAAGRDGARLPGPAHRGGRRAGRAGRGDRGADRRRGRAPTTRTPTPWSAGSPSAAPTWTSGPSRCAAELGLAVDLDHPMTGLSGGQAARAGLASLLLSRYDVFLLDEPTNDLDLDGLDRLERFVTGLRAGTVLVSHDREFLTRTVTRVVELDLAQQQVKHYGGGYAAYLEEREVARRHAREEYEEYADTKAGLEARARTQRGLDGEGRAERPPQGHRQRQDRPQVPQPRRPRSRPPRPSRPSG